MGCRHESGCSAGRSAPASKNRVMGGVYSTVVSIGEVRVEILNENASVASEVVTVRDREIEGLEIDRCLREQRKNRRRRCR